MSREPLVFPSLFPRQLLRLQNFIIGQGHWKLSRIHVADVFLQGSPFGLLVKMFPLFCFTIHKWFFIRSESCWNANPLGLDPFLGFKFSRKNFAKFLEVLAWNYAIFYKWVFRCYFGLELLPEYGLSNTLVTGICLFLFVY